MDIVVVKTLRQEFPALYGNGAAFSCGNGWYYLIYKLSCDLMLIASKQGIEPPRVEAVEQKYGGLRYHAATGCAQMLARIEQAEIESEYICEICGMPGMIRDDGFWMRTRCDNHDQGIQAGN